ncbi:Mitochondrial inner membrane translocase subunit (TIM17) [Rasamsonia emersonii CBS 393.64]|uniref:Mitochondrial inner membrane translocase subunit (TIM17) n=1 Tax=Rasamsonia emersonii (strain ATCC 16479 / CBS 393.64 / IMI 116815) TaxID=1408163 RepID=A0A0F4YUU2_RASE3|nr:Mitochondrial inner membrane translocase subunit (TIM17) [Rasamsonia emersonii CBS 393.64]KKA21865.1 Mitochondrial inner membrane translocase subunit (TIM17) [Rasamsonia emersonii CBS 393.64]
MDHSRDPCPWVALSDFGGAFCMGAIGGAVWHGVKGFRNSPYGERRIGAITAIKARAPVLGGNFGVWGGMFSTFDCAIKGIRKKEDPYNAIIAGFFTGGALAIRGGYKAARNSAIMCAVFLAVIEGVGIGFQRMMADNTKLEVAMGDLIAEKQIDSRANSSSLVGWPWNGKSGENAAPSNAIYVCCFNKSHGVLIEKESPLLPISTGVLA